MRGFALIPVEERKRLGSKGGYTSAYVYGTQHELTKEERARGARKVNSRYSKEELKARMQRLWELSVKARRKRKLLKVLYED